MSALADVPLPDTLPQEAPPQAAPAPQEAPAAPEGAQIPSPFKDVAEGRIPAVVVPPLAKGMKPDELQMAAIQAFPDIVQTPGIELYEAKDSSSVFFNPEKISAKDVKAADKAGDLLRILKIADPSGTGLPQAAQSTPGAAAAMSPMPSVPKAPPAVRAGRLANLGVQPGPAIQPNPIPAQLARRAL